ncbi:MAG: phosphomannomutase/phosphoglucomutase [Planctomycetes bacterium]|nr:phosphomannomutase/phosphoglucomutase [Planctomycetota bacterium]
MGIFKAYDIRGVYPEEIDERVAARIGAAVTAFAGAKCVVVGRDVRASSPAVARAVAAGAVSAGADVLDIGTCTTPMSYFAVGTTGADAGIMVTASHNPPQYSGFKICRRDAIPVSESSGLHEIESLVKAAEGRPLPPEPAAGRVQTRDLTDAYLAHVLRFLPAPPERRLRVVIDTANGCVGPLLDRLLPDLPCDARRLFFDPDGRFPNHEPNPLKDSNLKDCIAAVRSDRADLGIAFDGDGDRCMFLDERGERIPSDLLTAIIARHLLEKQPGSAIVYDLRSSWVVREEIEKAGGRPVLERVGHSFIKATMRREGAIFGGELSGHYYFRDHFTADSGLIAMMHVLGLALRHDGPVSSLIAPLRRYHQTGEVNFHVDDTRRKIEELARRFADGRQSRLDGISIEYPDWWFNVRPSNTEPVLRLNLEARTADRLVEAKAAVLKVLGSPEAG